MSIDLNTAEEQSEGSGRKALPPDSVVLVQMIIRQPKAGHEGSSSILTRSKSSSMEYLDCEFVIAHGSAKGGKFYNNMMVSGASTQGQKTAIDISMRTLRAMVEASRGIDPKDMSPAATQGRILQAWEELNGLYFPAMLDCEVSDPDKNGKRWVNNKLKRVITPDKPEYDVICDGGEIITDNPLPSAQDAPAEAKPGWAAPNPAPVAQPPRPAAPAPMAPPAGARPAPAWAQTPPPASPQNNSGVPF